MSQIGLTYDRPIYQVSHGFERHQMDLSVNSQLNQQLFKSCFATHVLQRIATFAAQKHSHNATTPHAYHVQDA
jgi:hypothetical protein